MAKKPAPLVNFMHFPTQKEAREHLIKQGLTNRMAAMLVSYDRMSNDWMADMVQAAIVLETGRPPRYGSRPRVAPEDPERIVQRPTHFKTK